MGRPPCALASSIPTAGGPIRKNLLQRRTAACLEIPILFLFRNSFFFLTPFAVEKAGFAAKKTELYFLNRAYSMRLP
jgi:hypothetical protein